MALTIEMKQLYQGVFITNNIVAWRLTGRLARFYRERFYIPIPGWKLKFTVLGEKDIDSGCIVLAKKKE